MNKCPCTKSSSKGDSFKDVILAGAKCFVLSLGCPKNRVDSEWVKKELESHGHSFVNEPEAADVVFINTCSFIEDAVIESVDAILEALELRRTGAVKGVVVLGCLPQRFGGELAESLPEVDLFIGCSELGNIAGALKNNSDEPMVVSRKPSFLPSGPFVRTPSLGPHTAYVKVSEGCDRTCSFCTVPSIRGPARSRSLHDIKLEVEGLVDRGVQEVNLVAQDLTAYGADGRDNGDDLARLLAALGSISGLRWIRPLYLYPSAVTHRLLEVMASVDAVVPYLDIPLQHVSDPVLKKMKRGYGERTVNRLMERIKKLWPQAFIRATFLVGHPGESSQAYEELEVFIKRWKLDHVGIFTFSPEEGTVAAKLPRPPEEIALKRRNRCMEIQREISREKLQAMQGNVFSVISDGKSEESDYLYKGRHAGQAPEIDGVVYIAEDRRVPDGAPRLNPGDWLDVEIVDSGDYDLVGAVVSPPN